MSSIPSIPTNGMDLSFTSYGPAYFDALLGPETPIHRTMRYFEEFVEENTRPPMTCTNCSSGQVASFYCISCPEYLCPHCTETHTALRALRDHKLVHIEEPQPKVQHMCHAMWTPEDITNGNVSPMPRKRPMLSPLHPPNRMMIKDENLNSPAIDPKKISELLRSQSDVPLSPFEKYLTPPRSVPSHKSNPVTSTPNNKLLPEAGEFDQSGRFIDRSAPVLFADSPPDLSADARSPFAQHARFAPHSPQRFLAEKHNFSADFNYAQRPPTSRPRFDSFVPKPRFESQVRKELEDKNQSFDVSKSPSQVYKPPLDRPAMPHKPQQRRIPSLFRADQRFNPANSPTTPSPNSVPYTEIGVSEALSKIDGHAFSFGGEGVDDGQLNRPWGICCDLKNRILVSDRSNNRIQVFTLNGVFLFKFGKMGHTPGDFNRPAGLAVNQKNEIIVADKDNHRVQVFDEDGRFLFTFGQNGRHACCFNYPWGVATNRRNDIAITDSRNNRIQVFNELGDLIRICGRNMFPMMERQVFGPRGVVFVDDDTMLVSDFNGHRILRIDTTKQMDKVEFLGCEGVQLGQFTRPQGMALDGSGNLLVCDSRANRIQVINVAEKKVVGFIATSADPMDRPTDITIGPDGQIYVVDFGPSMVRIF